MFNKAMLGKQGWRLISRPESLCAQVLNVKYYPNCDFLLATNKRRSSTTWKAIMHGKDVLTRGVINRIGPSDVNIWTENWISGLRSLKPLIRMEKATAEMVHDLFVLGTRVWDEEVVHKSFVSIGATEVLKVMVSTRLEEDVMAWALEKHGVYSVRSAYRPLKQEQMEKAMATGGETSSSRDATFWGALVKLDVPPKVRVLWWRVLHNALPSKSELKRRHIAKKSYCETCGEKDESLFHVFFSCPIARCFWSEVKKTMGVTIPELHPCTWAQDLLWPETCSRSSQAVIIGGAWALWTGRNACRHGRKAWDPGAAARFISSLMEDLASLKQPCKVPTQKTKVPWEKPRSSFDQEAYTSSAGVVIRDHNGQVIAAAARWFDDIPDVLMAEAIAAKEGLELAVELGMERVSLEVDCQGLSNLLQRPNSSTSSVGGLCFDITELGKNFKEFSISWISIEANSVVHFCAFTV